MSCSGRWCGLCLSTAFRPAGRVPTYEDYLYSGRERLLPLPALELIRRFLLQILPKGLVRIRYYGQLANRRRAEAFEHCRKVPEAPPPRDENPEAGEKPLWTCSSCREGRLKIVEWIGAPEPYLNPFRERAPPYRSA